VLAVTSFLGAIASPFATVGGSIRTLTNLMIFGRSRGWGVLLSRSRIDYRSEIGDPSTNSVVGAVVGWLARNFPEAPIRIVHDGTQEPAYTASLTGPGAMLRLMERPNPYYSGVLQWMATLVDWFCRGNAYWLKVRSPGGRVEQLWWVPERMMEPKWPENDDSVFIGWYEYTVESNTYRIDPRNVVHFRNGIDPNNPRKGLSRLASLFREIFTDDEASNFSASLLRNLGVPGVVISPSNTGGPAARTDPEAVKTSFMEKFGGDKRGEPLILTAPTDVKVLSFNPQQMELRELRRIPEERISAVLGVPASVAGLGAGLDQNSFTSYGVANVVAYTQGVIPAQRLFAADLEAQLLPDFADPDREALDVWFDWTKVTAMRDQTEAVWKQYESSATKGLITRATFKRATGQPVTPEDEVYIVPNNYQLIEAGGIGPRLVLPAGKPEQRLLPAGEAFPLLTAGTVTDLRCQGMFNDAPCGRLLAEIATPPYRYTCRRCKTVTEAGQLEANMPGELGAIFGIRDAIRSLAEPPTIHVEAPVVNVEPTDVHVHTDSFVDAIADLKAMLGKPKRLERNAEGRIIGVVTEE
jgi:HK97 family phage portal protein